MRLVSVLLLVLASAASAQPSLRPALTEGVVGRLGADDDTLTTGEWLDRFPIVVEAGQTVTIELASNDFDPYLVLKLPGGEQVDNDDWNGSRRVSRIDYRATAADTLEALVTTYAPGMTGEYAVEFSVAFPSDDLTSPTDAQALAGTIWAEDCSGQYPVRAYVRLDADGTFSRAMQTPMWFARETPSGAEPLVETNVGRWSVEGQSLALAWTDGHAASQYALTGDGILAGRSSAVCGTEARLLRMP